MRKLFVTGVLLIFSCAALAQYRVSGTIREKNTNRPLAGATIQVDGTKTGTTSDEFGRFSFDKLAEGEHIFTVRFLGYADRIDTVKVPSDASLELTLEETSVLTDEVVVTATRANDKTPTTFYDVSRPAIQKQNFGQDLPLVLNWTPSVVTTSDAGAGVGYTGIRIRGSDATRVNVTINGIPYNDSESQGTFWVDIPDIASSTQSIQIQRGVGSSTNGAGAFGASVNLQTNSLQADPYAQAIFSAGSFNTQRYTLRAGTGLINDHWAFDAKISRITSDGYVERASSDLGSYYLSGGYYGKKTVIKAIAFGGAEKTYQSWYGVDSATMATNRRMNYAGAIYGDNSAIVRYYDNQVDDYKQDHYQFHVSQKMGENWNANLSLHYTYGRGFYEEYHQGESFSALGLSNLTLKDTTLTTSDVIVRKWLDNHFYGGTWSMNYAKGRNTIVIGGAYNQYADARHFGEIIWAEYAGPVPIRHHYYEGKAQKNDFNVFAKWNYDLTDRVNTFIDLQYRHVDYMTRGLREDQSSYDVNEIFSFFNPKVGVSYSLSENTSMYASYAIANREPNRTDYLESTVKPLPEKLGNLELGLRRNSTRYSLEANYYLMNYTDQLVLTGQLDNAGFPIRANVGKSYRTGVEVSALLRLASRWTWNVNATGSVNRNNDYIVVENGVPVTKNTEIILSPSLIAGSQLTFQVVKGFQATLLSKYVGKQYLDNTETAKLTLDSYFINDLRLNYQLNPRGMKEIGISLLVNNLLDVSYSSNGYSYSGTAYYYPQAGRNFMAMLTLNF